MKWVCKVCEETKKRSCLFETEDSIIPYLCPGFRDQKANWQEVGSVEGKRPTLTREIFDHPQCPSDAHFAFVTDGGQAYWIDKAPELVENRFWKVTSSSVKMIPGRWNADNWTSSLICRDQSPLPSWLQVECLVWNAEYGYGRVIEHQPPFLFSVRAENGTIHRRQVRSVWYPARWRMLNPTEMKGLVSKVVECNGLVGFFSIYDEYRNQIYAFGEWFSPGELLTDECMVDGRLCGVLQHLNNNLKWVE